MVYQFIGGIKIDVKLIRRSRINFLSSPSRFHAKK